MHKGAMIAAAGLLLAGCVSSKTTSTAPVVTTPEAVGVGGGVSSAAPPAQQAHVGDGIGLEAENGDTYIVTLLAVRQAVKATDGFSTPDKGKRYAAAEISIAVPAGDAAAYDDSPSNGAAVLTTDGQSWDADLPTDTTAGHALTSPRITPGRTVKGWITFQVPTGSKINAFQFAVESGFGNGGEWVVP